MLRLKNQTIDIREKFEECGHTLSLFIDLCTSNIELTERSKLALTEYGKSRMEVFEDMEEMLRDYETDTAPS